MTAMSNVYRTFLQYKYRRYPVLWGLANVELLSVKSE